MIAERFLVLDGSLGFCIVAIVEASDEGRRVVAENREYRLPLMQRIAAVVPDERSRLALTGVVVGTGPGSFTSIRLAASTAAGIAAALRIPLRTSDSDVAVLEAVGRAFSMSLGVRESIEVTSAGSELRARGDGSPPVGEDESAEVVAMSLVRHSKPESGRIALRYLAPARGAADR